jgi:hypothetical protein
MTWKPLGAAAAALALLAVSGGFDTADARHGGHGGMHHGGGSYIGAPRHMGGPAVRHHHRGRVFVGSYPSYYYYDDGCYWLRRRANYTGSPYWWERYNDCRYGYGY